jgi:glycosyltransferase involved in cell wall biosynthesis
MLDIIIPQYSEDNNMIKPLLDSIKNQIDIDFSLINITIVNDYSNTLLDLDFLDSYNLGIKYYRNERNTGPGLARQYGILNTNDKFIMFIDADDRLYSNKSLYYVIDFIKKNNPDYVIGNIAVEDIIN